ncbi:DUF6213 family protein [Streptomyces cinereoruber]|uniref:DUF6213 family protein n=1 Tax=Streptomyces TaxID=1883 RepID=UPI0007874834|nr:MULTISPECIES: DUF6213 family protein [unclassified Streptomyces]KYG51679.1 hypothetical protein AWI43_30270 [Streptomyces sp. WAC04657]
MSLVLLPDGHLVLPADEVTGLLRHLAAGWLESTGEDDLDLAPETVVALAGALTEVADRIDVECIALAPRGDEDPFDQERPFVDGSGEEDPPGDGGPFDDGSAFDDGGPFEEGRPDDGNPLRDEHGDPYDGGGPPQP